MEYYLMNKDQRLLSFKTEYSFGDTVVTETEQYAKKLPIGFTDISLWLENRNYAKHKESLKGYLSQWGMDNVDGFIEITHCLGLNDTLWVKTVDSNLCWSEVSLYTNDFSDVMEKTAFGNGLNGIEISTTDLTSPEFVSPGSFAKCWKREEDGIYLYKAQGSLSQGNEPFSEFFASQIAEKFSVPTVKYELTKLNGRLCTKCKMFTSEKVGLVSFAGVFDISKKRYNIPSIIAACEELGFGEEIRQMYLLDCLTLNQDRHLGNIGFLFDNDTFEIIGFSPIYDFNVSMLGDAYREDMKSRSSIDAYMVNNSVRPKASDASFFEVAISLGVKLPADVDFGQHELYRMEDERFSKLSEYISLNFERIKHKNNDLHRVKIQEKCETLADHLLGLNYTLKDGFFCLELLQDDFKKNDYLGRFSTMYGLGEDERIVIKAQGERVECFLVDEFGESQIGKDIVGGEKEFVAGIKKLQRVTKGY
ncbi:MAG: HipA domain-containing protein [Pseudobutyrivibrio sp.]|nr:HipA domain-containing protein [Pseudobutyrivibrio sp.]